MLADVWHFVTGVVSDDSHWCQRPDGSSLLRTPHVSTSDGGRNKCYI